MKIISIFLTFLLAIVIVNLGSLVYDDHRTLTNFGVRIRIIELAERKNIILLIFSAIVFLISIRYLFRNRYLISIITSGITIVVCIICLFLH